MSVYAFLQNHIAGHNEPFTHTGLSPMIGKYFIPPEHLDLFYKYYVKSLKKNEVLSLTEMHEDISPLLVDIDLRFQESIGTERQYTLDDIKQLMRIYFEQINKYFRFTSPCLGYVFEKDSPVRFQGNIKDGIHFIFPTICSKPDVQYQIRENIISLLQDTQCISGIGFKNPIEDVIDKAIIMKNPWLMYGSCKPNQEAYKLTHVFDENMTEHEHPNIATLPRLLSIRNCACETELKTSVNFVDSKPKKQVFNTLSKEANAAIDLVNILSKHRADNYEEWIELGFCLHNIDTNLLQTWIEFSKISPKFQDGACEKLWKNFKNEGLTIASLYRWAKIDNPEKFKEIKHNEISQLLQESLSGTNYDVAVVVHAMFKHQFANASIKHNKWYEFRDHRWQDMDKGLNLRKKISTDVANEYKKLGQYYRNQLNPPPSDDQKKVIESKLKRCDEMIKNVKMTTFKDKVMSECSELFYDSQFLNKLDSNVHLIGFDNGVYDLDRSIFRDGLPDDYISYSTHIDYIELDQHSEHTIEINEFIKKVLPDPDVRKYVLLLLCSFLNGRVDEQKFHIWTGSGGNGKSKLVELFEKSFGDYCGKLPITVLTQKRSGSSAASPEIAKTKGKRFISLQEPEHDDQIHVGYMKELSGGDVIQARALYAEPVEFKPQFKIILTCNQLPSIPSTDGGTWRRLRVVDFPSKFVDNPVNPGEFKKENIDGKLAIWKVAFMTLLLEVYKTYKSEGICEPPSVVQFTKEYQKSSDCIMEYLEEHIVITEDKKDTVLLTNVLTHFRAWYKDMYCDKAPGRKIIKPYLEKFFGKTMQPYGWKCAKLVVGGQDPADDTNNDL
jgi:P4 family phage/plasmid primase-like protien